MRALVITLQMVFGLSLSCLYSQADSILNLGIEDIYILRVEFEERLLENDCDCCSNITGKECLLLRGKINEVIAMSDSSVFHSDVALKEVQFFIVEKSSKQHIKGEYFVSCANTCSSRLIKINRYLPETVTRFDLTEFYIGDLLLCYDFNWIQRLQLRLGIRRNRIYDKAKLSDPEVSEFIQAILQYTESNL